MAEELTFCEAYSPISDVDPDDWWESAGRPTGPLGPSFFDPATHHWPMLGPPLPLTDEEAERETRLEADMHARLQQNLDEGNKFEQSLWAEINLPSWLADPGKSLDEYEVDRQFFELESATWEGSEESWEDYRCQEQSDSEDHLGDWPRRLLHVPTMTSYEWQPGNRYGPFESPRYAAISYTWGRWALAEQVKPWIQPPHVNNISWVIPRVDEDLFTVAEFQQAIDTCVSPTNGRPQLQFIWLDVACINQNEGDRSGALEIGRQAKIFGGADRVFVWLAENRSTQTRGQWDCFESAHRFIKRAASFTQAAMPHIMLEKKNPNGSVDFSKGKEMHSLLGDLFDREGSNLSTLNAAIRFVTKAPWFSSLWTLQEAFLRTDSSFLMPDGSLMVDQEGSMISLRSFVQACGIMHRAASGGRLRTDSLDEQFLLHSINSSGLDALSSRNPMSLYTGANRRQTQRPLDRIYGIMQVFRFQLGDASPEVAVEGTKKEWTLAELEIEMGAAMIQQFPLMSQLHVHRDSVFDRQAWRISKSSVIPALARDFPYTEKGEILGKVDACSSVLTVKKAGGYTYGYFKSKACSLETLKAAWATSDKHKRSMNLGQFPSIVHVALDSTIISTSPPLQVAPNEDSFDLPRNEQQHTLVNLLASRLRRFNKRALVVLLGHIIVGEEAFRGEIHSEASETYVGLIVMECHDNTIGRWWKRLGICVWDILRPAHDDFPILRAQTKDWIQCDGLFG